MHKARGALCFFLLTLFSHLVCANVIVAPKTKINIDTFYKNTTLDLTHGSWVIQNNATLVIQNSKIIGTISPENPNLIMLQSGKVVLKNNSVSIASSGIPANPHSPSLYYAIQIQQGEASITGNRFVSNKSYTVGLLTTNRLPTAQIEFKQNFIKNMHGGILLRNSRRANIIENSFANVSGSNIFILEGGDHLIQANTIQFAGNNNVGDGIDISDADNVFLIKNSIYSGSCYSLVIFQCKNILIDSNFISGGITYAIYITSGNTFSALYQDFYSKLRNKSTWNYTQNHNIIVQNNHLALNRYGLAANNVESLTVRNNIFIQNFRDQANRKFWTNNDLLFQRVSNLEWHDNLYKEGYSQESDFDKHLAKYFVVFPQRGGVVLA